MKTKLFSLLLLLLCLGSSGAWADTYTDEEATVTWAFTSHSSLGSTNSPEDAFLTTNFSKGSNLATPTTFSTSGCKAGWAAQNLVYFKPVETVAKNADDAAGNMLEWSITPASGITFTPSNVSVTACTAGGTGDPQVTIYAVYSDNSQETVQARTNPRRPDKTGQGDGPSVFSKDLVNAVSGAFKVRLYFAGLTNTEKGAAVTNIVVTGTVSGTPVSTTNYTITASVNDSNLGSVSGGGLYEENSDVSLTAEPKTGGKFVKWQKGGEDFEGNTANPLNITATETVTYTAIFEALNKITFSANGGTGTVPATSYVDNGDDLTIPSWYLLYKPGYTFTGWKTGETTYKAGESIENISEDITLSAQFTANTVALGDAAVTVNWSFDNRTDAAPSLSCENSELDYAQHVTISGTAYDAVMHVNTITGAAYAGETGKLNNLSKNGYAQVNKGAIFTIPAVPGMTISYTCTNGTPTVSSVKFAGNDAASVSDRVLSYTYSGASSTINIVAAESNLYPSGISVSYPAAVLPPSFSPTSGSDVNIGENITITDNAGGATIYYQWDGNPANAAAVISGGTTGTTVSTSALSAGSHTLYAVAVKNEENSVLSSATYTLESLPLVTMPTNSRTGYSCSVNGSVASTSNGVTLKDKTVYTISSGSSITLTVPATTIVSKIVVSGTSGDSSNGSTVTISGTNDEASSPTAFNNRKGDLVNVEFTPTTQTTTYTISSSSKDSWVTISIYGTEHEAVSTLAGRNYGTCVTSSALDFTNVTDAKAYIATGLNGNSDAVVLTRVYKVPADEPLIIYTTEKASAKTVYVPKTTESADAAVGDNKLVAGDDVTAYNATANTTYYYLAGDLFHEATSGTLKSGKAYLAVSASGGARQLSIAFADEETETTGIAGVNDKKANAPAGYFDLQGRRVAQPTKGLYIVNGKKVLVK